MARVAVKAAFDQSIKGAPKKIVYFPEGTHEVHAEIDGKPDVREIVVDSSVLAAFEADLEERLAMNVRPFLDFNHEGAAASALPVAFSYEDGKGLMLEVDWTSEGKDAIEGKVWSYFSPEFLLDEDGRPVGLMDNGPIGGLVNNPAFEQITRIAASRNSTKKTNQTPPMSDLVKCGLLTETEAAKSDADEIARKRFQALQDDAKKVAAANTRADKAEAKTKEAKEQLEAATKALDAHQEDAADEAVKAAVKAGKISAKDETTQAFWKTALLNQEGAKEALENLPVNPVLAKTVKDPSAGDRQKDGENPILKAVREAKENGKSVRAAAKNAVRADREAYEQYTGKPGEPGLFQVK